MYLPYSCNEAFYQIVEDSGVHLVEILYDVFHSIIICRHGLVQQSHVCFPPVRPHNLVPSVVNLKLVHHFFAHIFGFVPEVNRLMPECADHSLVLDSFEEFVQSFEALFND